jgi:hypothetical protein
MATTIMVPEPIDFAAGLAASGLLTATGNGAATERNRPVEPGAGFVGMFQVGDGHDALRHSDVASFG